MHGSTIDAKVLRQEHKSKYSKKKKGENYT